MLFLYANSFSQIQEGVIFINRRFGMLGNSINEHLCEAKDYLTGLALEGFDISAHYIAQAHLTKLLTHLRPQSILNTLFDHEELENFVAIVQKPSSRFQIYNQLNTQPLLKYFKNYQNLLHCDPIEHSIEEVSLLLLRINESLEEWPLIRRKSDRLRYKLQRQKSHVKQIQDFKAMQNSLDGYLDKLLKKNHHNALTTTHSSNHSDLMSVDIQQQAEIQQPIIGGPSKEEIISFMEFLSMWMGQLLRQILDYKSILEPTKSQPSVSIDSNVQMNNRNIRNRKKMAKASLLTSKIKQAHIDIPHICNNFFEEQNDPRVMKSYNINKKGFPLPPKSAMECYKQKQLNQRRHSQRVVLGQMNSNIPNEKREKIEKRSSQTCSKCQIY